LNSFKEKEKPKLLIVTDMLVTGFDAPVLQTLYLDKLLKEHRLLQTIARTNRPYAEKHAGLIVDYVGVLSNIKSALRMYFEGKNENVLFDMKTMKKEFVEALEDAVKVFSDKKIIKGDTSNANLVRAVKFLNAEEYRLQNFKEAVQKARRLYELLGSSESKVDNDDDYKWIICVYGFYKKNYEMDTADEDRYVDKYFRKTLDDIYAKMNIDKIVYSDKVYFDSKTLGKMMSEIDNKEVEAASIVFALRKYLLVDKGGNPVFVDLLEKVKKLITEWEKAKSGYDKIIERGKEILKEKNEIENKQKALGMSDAEYSVYRTLLKYSGDENNAKKMTTEIIACIKDEGDYLLENIGKPEVAKMVSQITRKYLRKQRGYGIEPGKLDDITGLLIEDLKGTEYGK